MPKNNDLYRSLTESGWLDDLADRIAEQVAGAIIEALKNKPPSGFANESVAVS